VYPDERVSKFIIDNFIPVRVHVRDQAEEFQRLSDRYDASWTPTILILDSDGTERHRIEGALDRDSFLAQLELGLGHLAYKTKQFTEAEKWFKRVEADAPQTDAAPEAMYWEGVSRYKGTNDASALGETARRFSQKYQDTSWAKKASVWLSS
jgi:thioredoxin-related protein